MAGNEAAPPASLLVTQHRILGATFIVIGLARRRAAGEEKHFTGFQCDRPGHTPVPGAPEAQTDGAEDNPGAMIVVSKVRRSLARRGVRGTAVAGLQHFRFLLSVLRERGWDWLHGIDTAEKVEPAAFGLDSPILPHVHRYEPVTGTFFRRMMRAVPLGQGHGRLPAERCVFIDLGSGKGRALLFAARYPFRKLIGVEIAPRLHEIASRNVLRFAGARDSARFDLRCGDAASFHFPPEPVVLFLYNPFDAAVLAQVIGNMVASLNDYPRPFFVLYRNPVLSSLFEREPAFRVLKRNRDYAVYAARELRSTGNL